MDFCHTDLFTVFRCCHTVSPHGVGGIICTKTKYWVLVWGETSTHAVTVVFVACAIRFMGVDRIWTASVAACTSVVTFPSVIFLLGGDYVHALLVAAALTNIVPMLRFAMNGRLEVLYSRF